MRIVIDDDDSYEMSMSTLSLSRSNMFLTSDHINYMKMSITNKNKNKIFNKYYYKLIFYYEKVSNFNTSKLKLKFLKLVL